MDFGFDKDMQKPVNEDKKNPSGKLFDYDHAQQKPIEKLLESDNLYGGNGDEDKFQKRYPDHFEHIQYEINNQQHKDHPFSTLEPAKKLFDGETAEAQKGFENLIASSQGHVDNFKKDFGNEFAQFSDAFKENTSDLLSGIGKQANSKAGEIIDFMASERGFSSGTSGGDLFGGDFDHPYSTSGPPSASSTQSMDAKLPKSVSPAANIYDESSAENFLEPRETFNPSPIKNNLLAKEENNEKFISSEDLLGDFRQSETKADISGVEKTKLPQAAAEVSAKTILPPAPTIPSMSSLNEEFSSTSTISKPVPIHLETKDSSSKVVGISTIQVDEPAKKEKKKMISAEEIFYRFGLDAWFKPERLHPQVESLIYWRDVKKSGIVFGAGLILLLAISCFSVISVLAYTSLLVLAGTVVFRIYKNVLGAVQKTSEGHPFKEYLEFDLNLSQEKVQQIVNVAVAHLNAFVSELRRLFLVEDLVDSIKFGVILWFLTYIGAWFNGITLVILAYVALFTLPKVYENNKQSIDTYLDLVRTKFLEITEKVKAAVPIGKKPESEKDK